MECLNCGTAMVDQTVISRGDRISCHVCAHCGSLWLDAGELDKMAADVEGSIEYSSAEPAEQPERPRTCPRCEGVGLEKVRFLGAGDIVLDRCPNCEGFWLDGPELELINRELKDIMPVRGEGFSRFLDRMHLPYWRKRLKPTAGEQAVEVDPPPLREAERCDETDEPCPACGADLARYRAYGVEFEGCPRCKGIWLDAERLRRLKDRESPSLRWLDDEIEGIESAHFTESDRSCPQCADQQMLSAAFGETKVIIDWCPSCRGIWLDSQEFLQIMEHLKEELDEMSSEELKAVLRKELKDIWGGPEGPLSEARDAAAAFGALVNAAIFEHPRLARILAGPWPL